MKNSYCKTMQDKVEQERENARETARQFTLDAVNITLAKIGFTDFEKFRDEYEKIENELANVVQDEVGEEKVNRDKIREIWMSKETIDRELKEAVGDLFVPWETRYRLAYFKK